MSILIIKSGENIFLSNTQSANVMGVQKKEWSHMFVRELGRKGFMERGIFEVVPSRLGGPI